MNSSIARSDVARPRALAIAIAVAAAIALTFLLAPVAQAITPGTKKVAVIMVKFPDQQSQPFSESQLRTMIFGGAESVNAYYRQDSYNTVALAGVERVDGDVFGPYTVAANFSDGCDYEHYMTFASQARAAMQAAGHTAAYDYYVYVIPSNLGCPSSAWTDTAPSQHAFMSNTGDAATMVHEFGHLFGLDHSNRLACNTGGFDTTYAANATGCQIVQYGDSMDAMGSAYEQTGPLSTGAYRAKLGFIPTAAVQRVTSFGTYTVSDINTAPSGTKKQLLILPGPSTSAYRYVDYRIPQLPFDGFSATSEMSKGVGIRQAPDYEAGGFTQNVLQVNPASNKVGNEVADRYILEAGKTTYDPALNTTIKTVSVSAGTATINYSSGPPTAPSTVSVSGGALTFSATAGAANDVTVMPEGANLSIIDNGGALTAGAGCNQGTASKVTCPAASVSSLDISLGDMADGFASTLALPTRVSDGSGDDVVSTANANDVFIAGAGDDYFASGGGTNTIDNSTRTGGFVANLAMGSGVSTLQTSGSETDKFIGSFTNFVGGSGDDTVSTADDGSQLSGGDGNDIFRAAKRNLVIDGGNGTDTADFGARLSAVKVTLDDSANDGTTGEVTNVKRNVESVIGTPFTDDLSGSDASDTLSGSGGDDTLTGGAGADSLSGGDGNDLIKARDGVVDSINCGDGTADSAVIDPAETPTNCESSTSDSAGAASLTGNYLRFTAAPGATNTVTITKSGSTFTINDSTTIVNAGSGCVASNANTVTCTGTAASGAKVILNDGDDSLDQQVSMSTEAEGNDGNDTLRTKAGEDILLGGNGNDTLDAGSNFDALNGDAGDDVLLMRDGSYSDVGDCGEGTNDSANADEIDYAERCEFATYGAPVSITSGPANGSTIATSSTQFGFSSTEAGVSFRCKTDAAAFAPCSSPTSTGVLADGLHTFSVVAVDSGGLEGTAATRTFTVDTTAPTISISAPTAGQTLTTRSPSVAFTTSADAVTVSCKLDSAAASSPCTSPRTFTNVADGSHTVTIAATDAAGNTNSLARQFNVDATPPTLSIASPTAGQSLSTGTVTLQFSAGADAVSKTCQLDTGAIDTACASPKTYSSVANGSHSITVRASDSFGNAATQTVAFTVAATPPSLTLGNAAASGTVALGTAGPADWVHWGLSSTTSVNRKAGVSPALISNYTKIGNGSLGRATSGSPSATWTGGTPTATQSSATQSRLTMTGVNNGFRITAPASNAVTRTIKVYAGVTNARGALKANLSDGSVAAINDTSTTTTIGTVDRVFTITYRSQQPAATLTIDWTMSASNFLGANVRFMGAALTQ